MLAKNNNSSSNKKTPKTFLKKTVKLASKYYSTHEKTESQKS